MDLHQSESKPELDEANNPRISNANHEHDHDHHDHGHELESSKPVYYFMNQYTFSSFFTRRTDHSLDFQKSPQPLASTRNQKMSKHETVRRKPLRRGESGQWRHLLQQKCLENSP